jgi:hypothetical protein
MITTVPTTNVGARFKSPRTVYDKIHDNTMEMEVANVFSMLSAYFIVAATITPPTACI